MAFVIRERRINAAITSKKQKKKKMKEKNKKENTLTAAEGGPPRGAGDSRGSKDIKIFHTRTNTWPLSPL